MWWNSSSHIGISSNNSLSKSHMELGTRYKAAMNWKLVNCTTLICYMCKLMLHNYWINGALSYIKMILVKILFLLKLWRKKNSQHIPNMCDGTKRMVQRWNQSWSHTTCCDFMKFMALLSLAIVSVHIPIQKMCGSNLVA